MHLITYMYCTSLKLNRKLNHSKVGQLFGVVSHRPYYCVLELPVNGDLKTFLITTKTSNIE